MNRTKKILAIFLSVIVVIGIVTGCSSMGRKEAAQTASSPAPAAGYGVKTSMDDSFSVSFPEEARNTAAIADKADVVGSEAPKSTEAQGIRGTGYDGSSVTSSGPALDILAQRKVIRNANLSVEVDDFYYTYGNLQAMIKGIGYIQESNIHRDFYTFDGERKTRVTGDITIRVDARHFDRLLNDIKGLGEVIDDRIYSTDVTDQYYDTEGRLKILKIEYDYLEEYMRSLKDPDAIFKTRMRMTELQTEIERLTGTLNKWSDLVELSTIYIQMSEKYPEEMTKKKEVTYWDRLFKALSESFMGIFEALGDVLIFIIRAIPTLVVLAVFGFIGYRIFKKIKKKKKTAQPPEIKE